MIRIKRWGIFFMVLCIFISSSACGQKPQKPSPKSENEPKPMPKVIGEIEKDALKIMEQVDKIPYFQRVIVEKKKIEEEKKMEEEKKVEEVLIKAVESQGKSKDKKQEEKKTTKSEGSEEEKPKPMTIDEGILTELLKKEKSDAADKKEQKIPKDLSEIWSAVNNTILGLHSKWNVLEPQLIQQGVSPEVINRFETTLDNLTKFGIENKYFETLSVANNLTAYLPDFMVYYKKKVPPSIYTLKYHIRNLVLNAAVDNYEAAQESLTKLKEHGQTLKSQLIEKKAKATIDKYDASVINIEKSLTKKDLHLIKINSSIVLKNILLMEQDLAGSI